MKKLVSFLGKTGTVVSVVLTIVVSVITCWQVYQASAIRNLSGAWKLKFHNKSSSYKKYIGETHTQKLFFIQEENKVTGKGEKWEYNNAFLPYNMHRKLEYIGQIEDDGLKATYTMYGLQRESTGMIQVKIVDGGRRMVGDFTGTAGDVKGTVEGIRID